MAADEGPGIRDAQTVTPDGESTLPVIDGVVVRRPTVHLDHRGSLFEIYNGDPAVWATPIVYAYQASVLPGQIKGWARHELKTDRYTLAVGDLLVLLHDGRPDSPTAGVTQRVVLSPKGDRQLVIPTGVWHLLVNLGAEEAHVLNFPTEPYIHAAPDRYLLDWDTDELPVDVRSYLPKF
jgi:dTDP-4-dehydrorhamnose 3,5-epimerase